MKFFPACPYGNENRFFFQYTVFSQARDFSQTNSLDNWAIYIAVMELKYQESQFLNHQMFGRLHRLHFFHEVFEHQLILLFR